MPIVGFTGNPGTGKTLGMTWRLYELHKRGHPIYANYDLGFPFTKIESLEDLQNIRHGKGEKEAVLGLDEFWRWLDSRKWKTQKSDIVTEVIMYSRKRGFWVFWTAQKLHMMGKRIRDVTDAIIEPELSMPRRMVYEGKMQDVYLKCMLKWRALIRTGVTYKVAPVPYKTQVFCPLIVMPLYDTHQEVNLL